MGNMKTNVNVVVRGRGMFTPEIHIKIQATRHDCLPSLLDNGDK